MRSPQRCGQPGRIVLQHLHIFPAARGRQQRHAVVARASRACADGTRPVRRRARLNCCTVMPSALKRLHRGARRSCARRGRHGRNRRRVMSEDVAGRGLRDHQRMAWRARHDVEEGQHVVVLADLVAGNSPRRIFAKRLLRIIGGHGCFPVIVNSRRLLREVLSRRQRFCGTGRHRSARARPPRHRRARASGSRRSRGANRDRR